MRQRHRSIGHEHLTKLIMSVNGDLFVAILYHAVMRVPQWSHMLYAMRL